MKLSLFANNFELILNEVCEVKVGMPQMYFTDNNCDAVISLDPGKLYFTHKNQEFFVEHTQGAFNLARNNNEVVASIFCGEFIFQTDLDEESGIRCVSSLK